MGEVKTGDVETDAWLRRRAYSIAGGIRELKRLICAPPRDAPGKFSEALGGFLVAASLGNWDELALAQDASVERLSGRSRALRVSRTLVGGLAPFVVVILLVQQGVITGPMTATLLLLTGSLAFVVVLGWIDPQALERLPIAENLSASLYGPPSKKP
jgi:hypothetical protein